MNPNQRNNLELAGCRVLVVEDDYFIAAEICSALVNGGAEIVGPARDIQRGLELMHNTAIDCAVLDINLHGELIFQLADELRRRGTPWIFATGYDDSVVPPRLAGATHLEKPINLAALIRAVNVSCAAARTARTDAVSQP